MCAANHSYLPFAADFLARHLLDGIRSAMLGLMLRVQFPSSALWAQLMLAET